MIGHTVCVRVVMMRTPQARSVGALGRFRGMLRSLVVMLAIGAMGMQICMRAVHVGQTVPVGHCDVQRHGNRLRSDEKRHRYEGQDPHCPSMIEKRHFECQWDFSLGAIVQCAGAGSDYRPWRYVCGE
jgi:hypothetical protein